MIVLVDQAFVATRRQVSGDGAFLGALSSKCRLAPQPIILHRAGHHYFDWLARLNTEAH